jgi:asparagine synthase (glutamine-hydrolysing)
MCGIFSLLNNNIFDIDMVQSSFKKGKRRGPEFSKLSTVDILCDFGFHRLAINGLNEISNQPIIIDEIKLICNGEIYNYKELYKLLDIIPTTQSDCEIIIHLYKKYGIEYTLQILDGVFSFILCDSRLTNDDSKIYIARDPFGVRPLYQLRPINTNSKIYGFASEIKMLYNIYHRLTETHEIIHFELGKETHEITHFEPGTYSIFSLPTTVSPKWSPIIQNHKYYTFGVFMPIFQNLYINEDVISANIFSFLSKAVQKRVLTTERPIACLLSGGLDSSLITSLVNHYSDKQIETYSIGLEGSEDLKYAKIVADFLETKHTEVILTEQDFIDAIPEVICAIESYDTTTVRASIGNYLLAKYISQHSEAKVIFNGDGSDELCGGYLYMNYASTSLDFDNEIKRLLKDIHKFDVLRSDKSISSNGLEPRTPFLDRSFVQYYLSIDPNYRFHKRNNVCEKYLLRKAFDRKIGLKYNCNLILNDVLPQEVLWRKKEAFSDGVSKKSRSLYEIIQEHVSNMGNLPIFYAIHYDHNNPDTKEKQYYRYLYETYYSGTEKVVPYFWMPKWVNAKDASARTLDIYDD